MVLLTLFDGSAYLDLMALLTLFEGVPAPLYLKMVHAILYLTGSAYFIWWSSLLPSTFDGCAAYSIWWFCLLWIMQMNSAYFIVMALLEGYFICGYLLYFIWCVNEKQIIAIRSAYLYLMVLLTLSLMVLLTLCWMVTKAYFIWWFRLTLFDGSAYFIWCTCCDDIIFSLMVLLTGLDLMVLLTSFDGSMLEPFPLNTGWTTTNLCTFQLLKIQSLNAFGELCFVSILYRIRTFIFIWQTLNLDNGLLRRCYTCNDYSSLYSNHLSWAMGFNTIINFTQSKFDV